MRPKAAALAALLVIASLSPGAGATPLQATNERALDGLIGRCIASGGLRRDGNPARLELVDARRLGATVSASRPGLTLDQRVALIGRCLKAGGTEPGLVALLRAVADDSGDALTLGWAAFWEGDLHRKRHESPEAIASFETAADRFAAAGSATDRGNCFAAIALVYSQQGDSRSSLGYEQKALEVIRASSGENSVLVASRLQSIAFVHANLGEKEQALASIRQSLAIYEAKEGPGGPNAVDALSKLSLLHFIFRDFDRAAEVNQRVLPLAVEVHGRRSPGHAAALEALADVEEARQSFPRAVELYLEVLEIRRALDGPRSLAVASTLRKLGNARDRAGDRKKAAEDLAAALGIIRETEGERTASAAGAIKDLSRIRDALGEHRQAIEGLRQALAIERALYGDGHIALALTHTQIGQSYQRIGELDLAMESFREALAIVEKIPGVDNAVVGVLGMISTAHLDLGQPARAVEALERSLRLVRKIRGDGDVEVSRVLVQLGSALMGNRDYVGALNRLDEAQAIQLALPGAEVDLARTLIRVGRVRHLQGQPAEAEQAYRKALEIDRRTLGEAGAETLLARSALARLAFDRGRYAEAAEAYREGIETLIAAGRDRGPDLANDLKMLGTSYARSAQLGLAREAFDRAVDALRVDPAGRATPGLPDSAEALLPLDVTIAVLMAYGCEMQPVREGPPDAGKIRESLRALRLAADISDRLRERLVVGGPSKLLIGERRAELFPSIVGLCSELAGQGGGDAARVEAFEAAERGAARVFLESLARSRAASLGGVSPEFLAEEAALADALTRLDRQIGQEQSRPIARRDSKRVASLLEEQGRLRERQRGAIEQAERDFPAYASLKYPRPCTLDEARAVLAEDEVALHYILGDERSYLVVVEKKPGQGSSGVAFHEIPSRAALSRMVAALLVEKALKDPDAARERAAEAFRLLVGPASAAIRGKSLVIVPGGVLGKLPFEMLVEPSDDGIGRHLVEGHRVRYAPSLTALGVIGRWDRSRPAPVKGLWALGDPVYDRSDGRLAGERPAEVVPVPSAPRVRFDRLAGSGIEVERIAGVMDARPEDRLLGASATEGAIRRLSSEGKLGAYRYVHLATHGILGEADGTQPALVLSLVGIPPGEDGYLRLDEVTGLRLNADLVVLSACGSGQGRDYRLEGVTGLARAFLNAGTRGVVCSLWRVDDAASADLMVDLYGGLKAGKPAAEALRAAKLRMIEAGEPPLHWAPFVLIGR